MAIRNQMKLSIKDDYTPLPGPRFIPQGPFSGEDFRTRILEPKFLEAVRNNESLLVDLDGGYGYGSSFLEEAFGGLAEEYDPELILSTLEFKSDEESFWLDAIKGYIRDRKKK
jgi:hypothetical protein